MFVLVGFDYTYTISDVIVSGVNDSITNINMSNNITTAGYTSYTATRSIMYGGVTGVLVPFLIFLTFASSFIDRNQTLISYLVYAMVIILGTPLLIYVFSDIITNLLNVNVLDTAYMATTYFQNFAYILIANMLLSLASFVFVIRGGSR
jgi:hypothetical protein